MKSNRNNPEMKKKVNLNKTLHFTATNLSNIEHTKKIFIIFGMMADWAEFYNKSFFLWVCYLLKCTVLNCFIPSTAFINQNLDLKKLTLLDFRSFYTPPPTRSAQGRSECLTCNLVIFKQKLFLGKSILLLKPGSTVMQLLKCYFLYPEIYWKC